MSAQSKYRSIFRSIFLLALAGGSWLIISGLRMTTMTTIKFRGLRDPISRWISTGIMIFAVLFCGLLSSSSSLHEIMHPDANNQHHQCAITIFAHGQVELTDGGPILADPVFLDVQAAALFESVILSSNDYLLLPGRAPPVPAS